MQQWRRRFYKSKQWRVLRLYILQRDKYICQSCGQIITDSPEVHHEVELTEANHINPDISLNPDLLKTLCKNCHNKKHNRFEGNKKQTIVGDDLNIDYSRR